MTMIRSISAAVVRFANDLFPPQPVVSHEFNRLHERCYSDVWEAWTTERGLAGLKIGSASAFPLGLVLHCRLLGHLTFQDVEDRGMHIAVGLGLVRGRQMTVEDIDHYGITDETITSGMIVTHRKWRGSVIFIARSDRSDRCDLWIGLHDELAAALAAVDWAEQERADAEEAAAEAKQEEKEAERARQAQLTRARAAEHAQTPIGNRRFTELADLHVHEQVPDADGTSDLHVHGGSGTSETSPSARARELIDMGVRDAAAVARQLGREGVKVPSDSYLRRLVREAKS